MCYISSLRYNIASTISSSYSRITSGLPAPVKHWRDKPESSLFNNNPLEFHQQKTVPGRRLNFIEELVVCHQLLKLNSIPVVEAAYVILEEAQKML